MLGGRGLGEAVADATELVTERVDEGLVCVLDVAAEVMFRD